MTTIRYVVKVLFPVSWVLPGLSREASGWKPRRSGDETDATDPCAKPLLPPRPPFCKPGVPRREGKEGGISSGSACSGLAASSPPPPLTFLREEARVPPQRLAGGLRAPLVAKSG